MPSRAVYTALAASRSETGCSTVLIPWVDEPVMVTPELVGRTGPGGIAGLRVEREGRASSCWLSLQLTAFLMSSPILASSAAVSVVSAKLVGHMAPSSRFAWSLKPRVAYLALNFSAV